MGTPVQTAHSGAVWSGSALFAYAILSETLVYKTLGHLLYSKTVQKIHFLNLIILKLFGGVIFNAFQLLSCWIN